jgi:hypothetical protein
MPLILGKPKAPTLLRLRPEMALLQLDPTLEASPIPSQNIFELELRTKMTTHRILTRIFTRLRSTKTRIFSILSSQSQLTTKMNVRSPFFSLFDFQISNWAYKIKYNFKDASFFILSSAVVKVVVKFECGIPMTLKMVG